MTIAVNNNTSEAVTADLQRVIVDTGLRPVSEQTRLVMGVADLYANKLATDDNVQAFANFFTQLVTGAAKEVRQGLSERLGSSDSLPPELARALANDEIAIARPVIAASPLLSDDDLLALLAKDSTDHRLLVALRPGLGAKIAEAILDAGEPLLMTALASNVHAQLPHDGVERLVEPSQKFSSLRLPLTRHPQLTETLAQRLYQWVGDTLRDQLCARYPNHAHQLKQAVSDTVEAINQGHIADRMEAAGHLTPLYLLRLLREGQLNLFIRCLSLMAGVQAQDIKHMLAKPSARPFYLVCLAAGIERDIFPTLFEALRRLQPDLPPPLLVSELRLGDRPRYQAKLELHAYVESLKLAVKSQ